jgi:putative transposase
LYLRRILDAAPARGIVVHWLSKQLAAASGHCIGFVIMPDHVHAVVQFTEAGRLSRFVQ